MQLPYFLSLLKNILFDDPKISNVPPSAIPECHSPCNRDPLMSCVFDCLKRHCFNCLVPPEVVEVLSSSPPESHASLNDPDTFNVRPFLPNESYSFQARIKR